jgi:DNA-binding transcriptional regulator GbsR (MarR family)
VKRVPFDPAQEPLSERHQDALERFIVLWGDMAAQWGINRTMAQIHALLYATARPLDTDEIMARLGISRGNANVNLRSLVDWRLARRTQRPGSRKDYYTAEGDVWRITTTIIEERQRREIQPVHRALNAVASDLRGPDAPTDEEGRFAARIEDLVASVELFDAFSTAVLPLLLHRRVGAIRRIMRFANRLRRAGAAAGTGGDAPASLRATGTR